MRALCVAGGEVRMCVAFVLPRVAVAGETFRSFCTDLHALLQTVELAEDLSSTRNEEPFVDATLMIFTANYQWKSVTFFAGLIN